MAFQEPRRQTEDLLLLCEETQYRASQQTTPPSFSPTFVSATTFYDASLTAAHIGAYIFPSDGNALDVPRQLLSLSGTTATFDVAFGSSTSTTRLRGWTPADQPIIASGAGSTISIVDATRHGSVTNEPDDFWNNYQLVFLNSGNAGKASVVVDFTATGGIFQSTDTITSTVAGDLAVLRHVVRPSAPPTVSVGQETAGARGIVGFADADVQTNGTKSGSASFTLELRGLASSAGSAVTAVKPVEMGPILRSLFTQDLDVGNLAHATGPGSGNSLICSAAAAGSVGGFVLTSTGEAGQIRAISSATYTLGTSHVACGNVAAGSTIYASAWYQRKATDFRTMTVDYYKGGLFRKVLHGCLPTMQTNISRDKCVEFVLNYTAGEAIEYTRTRPVTKTATLPLKIVDTAVPSDSKAMRVLLDGVNVLANGITIDWGFKPILRPSVTGINGADGCVMTLDPITISMKVLSDEDDRTSFEDLIDRLNRRASIDVFLQHGTAPKDVWCFCAPACQLVGAPQSYDGGVGYYDLTLRVVLPQAVPGNSFNAALPAAAMGWL